MLPLLHYAQCCIILQYTGNTGGVRCWIADGLLFTRISRMPRNPDCRMRIGNAPAPIRTGLALLHAAIFTMNHTGWKEITRTSIVLQRHSATSQHARGFVFDSGIKDMGGELSKHEGVLLRLFQSKARSFCCFFSRFTQIYVLITISLLDIVLNGAL